MRDDFHHVYRTVPDKFKGIKHEPAGRFLVQNGNLHILEDFHGALKHVPEGAVDEVTHHALSNLGPNIKVMARSDIKDGKHHELIPDAELEPLPQKAMAAPAEGQLKKPASVFYYTRAGHDLPHVLEVNEGQFLLDGNHLQHPEVQTMLHNLNNGVAKIRYKHSSGMGDAVSKMERVFVSLRKEEDDMDPQRALAHLSKLGGGDAESEAAIKALRRHVFEDPRVEGLGNKYAYSVWSKKPRSGVHIGLDLNHMKDINDTHGHHLGDAAIKAYGNAIKSSLQGTQSKAWFTGGDEASVWLPTHEHAATFARNLRAELEKVPPIGGTHRLSASMGIGHDPLVADKALYEAKKQKAGFKPHNIPHLMAHSLFPGKEGAIPFHDERKLTPPPAEVRAPEPAASASAERPGA